MSDLYAKAVNLLEKIANSIHERDIKNPNLICFSITEVQLVEHWLKDFIIEHEKLKSPDDVHTRALGLSN